MHKPASRRRTIRDALLSIGAVLIIAIVIVGGDERVRSELRQNITPARAAQEISETGTQAHLVVHVIKDQSNRHGPLLVMLIAGSMLALLMFRM